MVGYVVNAIKKSDQKIKILGTDKDLNIIIKKYKDAFIAVGSPYHLDLRKSIFIKLKKIGFNIPKIISKNAIVSSSALIGEGTIIMDGAQIGPNVVIGKNCIINSKTLVEHECIIEDHCNIATSVTINGNCIVGEKTFIGSGSLIRENRKISKNTFIKMGTVKIK